MICIPTPKSIEIKNLSVDLIKKIYFDGDVDSRVIAAGLELGAQTDTIEKGAISVSHGDGGEGYTLSVTEKGAEIKGDGPAGAFYGIKTLKALLQTNKTLSACEIKDSPDFPTRGFYHDVTRGKVPTLSTFCKLADMLSDLKINHLQLYVEDAFAFSAYEGIMAPDCMLTKEEILYFDRYCSDRFIELVPSMSTFGHLYNLLQSDKYKHLCEYENYTPKRAYWIEKMQHHTIDVSQDESFSLIASMIDEYLPLFKSKHFNICCDETFDLCKGKNKGKDPGEEYYKFLIKLINKVKENGKTVQMWGDIILKHPERLHTLPDDIVLLNWQYGTPLQNNGNCEFFKNSGRKYIVCPGTSTWSRFAENVNVSTKNIADMAREGYKNGAVGILNTNWGDFGNPCSIYTSLFGITFGAQCGWAPERELDAELISDIGRAIYGEKGAGAHSLLSKIADAENRSGLGWLVTYHSANYIEKRDYPLNINTEKTQASVEDAKLFIKEIEEMRSAASGKVSPLVFGDLILSVRAISLMNRFALAIRGFDEYKDGIDKDTPAFISELSERWLRDNKPSQLHLMCEFFREMAEIAMKNFS